MVRPCKNCGSLDRHKDGHCRPCKLNYCRNYHKKYPEKAAARDKKRRQDPVAHRIRMRGWKIRNPRKVSVNRRRQYEKNRENEIAYTVRWVREHPLEKRVQTARRRTAQTQAGGSYTKDEFLELCQRTGFCCLSCGATNVLLHADHVIPVSKGGTSDISNIQPLCHSCNSRKGDAIIDYRPTPVDAA